MRSVRILVTAETPVAWLQSAVGGSRCVADSSVPSPDPCALRLDSKGALSAARENVLKTAAGSPNQAPLGMGRPRQPSGVALATALRHRSGVTD